MKYVYPAVFAKEENGFSIYFPDVEGAYTCGDDLQEGIEMAEDVLCLTLYNMEINEEPIPEASDVKKIEKTTDELVTLIKCDTMDYRNFYNSKAVKKTLSIPAWMNEEATAKGINFSALLQESIKKELGM